MTDPEAIKFGLLRIVAYLPFIARRAQPMTETLLPVAIYIDGSGRKHHIEDMPNGYIHSAAAKLRREGRQPVALAAMDAEIARREAAKPTE